MYATLKLQDAPQPDLSAGLCCHSTHTPVFSCPLTLLLVLAGLLLQRPDSELDLFVALSSQVFLELSLAAQQPRLLHTH